MALSNPLLGVHIGGAIVGLLAGTAAMALRKGSRLHGVAGHVFTLSMLIMSGSATVLGLWKSQTLNALVGLLTFYLVATAWWTVHRRHQVGAPIDWGALALAVTIGASLFVCGTEAVLSASGVKDGESAGGYFVFGSVAFIAAAMDMRMLLRGGITGIQRILRHLWRMCFPMLIAVVSVTPRLHRLFPRLLPQEDLWYVPMLLALLAMVYFLARTVFGGAFRRRLAANV